MNGGGGLAYDEEVYDEPFRTTYSMPSRHAHFRTQPEYADSPGMGYPEPERSLDPERDIPPVIPPFGRASPAEGAQAWPAEEEPDIRPTPGLGPRRWPAHRARPVYSSDSPPIFIPGPAAGESMPSSLSPGPAGNASRKEPGFQAEARMSRPRDEETDRREPEAGAVPTKRNAL